MNTDDVHLRTEQDAGTRPTYCCLEEGRWDPRWNRQKTFVLKALDVKQEEGDVL